MTIPSDLITDKAIDNVWGNANFGEKLNSNRRNVVDNALFKTACGYSNGHTAQCIIEELKLVGKNNNLTKLGREYLYMSFVKDTKF